MSHQKAIQTTWISIAGNILLAVVKWITGYFGNSYALIADAIESTTDIFSSLLVLLGLKYASRPADKNHPYGHGRVEPLVTFLVVGILVASATLIAVESIRNIMTPHQTPESYTLIVLAVIIIFKELFFRFVKKRNSQINSTALKADAWHHRSDAITSLAAFIGIAIAIFMGKGFEAADDWAALVAAGFIFYNSYLIFRPALGEIMDEHLYEDVVEDIRKVAGKVEGVIDTEKCYVRKTGINFLVDLHITVSSHISVKAGHQIAHHLKDVLIKHNPLIADVLIHVEPDEHV
ncbi:MAG TPA: cation diffusion facilitator family transporter [Bacteroidia bacterium]|nr:cation transporter [Bacteroidia bacterium]QQR95041.1 MAG: cation transporter [Bacteroidota bacterium]MBP7714359.1 cation transporter [Bacteroidia bacterium]MBP8668851.1 cation transporter [Bacteroidia bacterium]HOZ82353.1 cation diffusion facilitator family transporter [Bacteroidia bacterium]